MGVHETRVATGEDLNTVLAYALSQPGPHVIEAVVPESLGRVKRRLLPWVLSSLPSLPASANRAIKHRIAP